MFCWERKSWTSRLLTSCRSKKGWVGLLKSPQKKVKTERKSVSSAHKLDGLGKLKVHLVLNKFIVTRTLVTYARTIFMPRCCLNFQSMRTQAESTYIAHNMFGQINMEIPWYINWHRLTSRKRDGKPRMISGQFVVVRIGVHQLSVSPNTSHPMLQVCSKLLHGNSMPSLNSTCTQHTPTQSLKSAQQLSCPAGTWINEEAVNWDQPGLPSAKCHYWY